MAPQKMRVKDSTVMSYYKHLFFFFIDGTKQVQTNDCSHVSLPMCNPMLFFEVEDEEYFYILYILVV